MEELPDGEVIRELSKGTRLHQEEAGRVRSAGGGCGVHTIGVRTSACSPDTSRQVLQAQPLGFVWRPEVGKSYGKLWAHCKVSFN